MINDFEQFNSGFPSLRIFSGGWASGYDLAFPPPLHKKLKLPMDMLVLTKEDTKKYRQSGQSLE